MARKITLNTFLVGSSLCVALIFGSILMYVLSSLIRSVQETSFVNHAYANAFELVDSLTSDVDVGDSQQMTAFLDKLLLRADVSYASATINSTRIDSSLGRPRHKKFVVDDHINQHGDKTFVVEVPFNFSDSSIFIGFDEEPIIATIHRIQLQTLVFIGAYLLLWCVFVVGLETYLKARFRVLVGISKDISQGRSLSRRNFALAELDELSQSLYVMDEQLRSREDNLRYLANHDAMTKVPNRHRFNQHLKRVLANPRRTQSLALIMVDIDKFKQVNDAYGHLFGDRLIRYLAISLKRMTRKQGLVARIGGDEFAVILDYRDSRQLDDFCRDILARIGRTIALGKTHISVSLSIGVATCLPQERNISVESLVHRADMALYQSKRERKAVCYHDENMVLENQRSKEIVRGFQTGLYKDEDIGLSVYFQPKYSLLSGDMVGVEALVRWFHPRLGYIEAKNIIEAVEEANLVRELTAKVMQRSIEALVYWRDNGVRDMKVAVNILPASLNDTALFTELTDQLVAAQLHPHDIEFEITEHTVLEQEEDVYMRLDDLKRQGYSIAIDDFGVGYANFRNLRYYPFSTIKIDRDFVSEILVNQRDRVIIQATTQIAKDLNMQVVAEGIEDSASIKPLRELGCFFAQGYLFSHAISKEEIVRLYYSSEVQNLILDTVE